MRVYKVDQVRLSILKSNPPKLAIVAVGQVTSTGWRNPALNALEAKLSPDGILDVEFVADPPSGISLPVLMEIVADLLWEDDVERVVGVRVVARTNEKTEIIHKVEDLTTLAVGEQAGGVFTTLALGEEQFPPADFPPRKWWIGETTPVRDIHKPVMREKQPFGEDFDAIEALVRPRNPFGHR